ncbi:MAG TPA: hypothetical protein PLO65_04170 [Caulobacter sp.]|nr:hypothetical protein [Caulobacter sp.]
MAGKGKPEPSLSERVERAQRRRTRLIWVQGLFFLVWQGTFLNGLWTLEAPLRTVDQVKLSGFVVWGAALLLLLSTGGGWFRNRALRAILEDESTRAHRRTALVTGFWVVMILALGLYVLSLFVPMTALEAVHALLTAGVVTPAIVFVALERRAERHG